MAVTFGRYELLTRLATGGMGEVYLARATGAGGFEKVFVLKRVLPHLAGNEEFRELFLDEARIAARLNHPNIAQIFELGDVDGQWFIVMEYVPGKDLRRISGTARARRQSVPTALACRIVADAAAALDYAHKARDPQGRSMKIVHRDVSPHNLLVSFDGVVKLIDFGVARAANRLQETGQGVLRGKYPYMSPEQVVEGETDLRSDQFSLGVVFWELLTGRRLFRSDSDAVTLTLVAECNVQPPATVKPGVPTPLDALVMRMLAREPAERFPDCGAVRLALEDWLLESHAPATPAHVGAWMRDLFPEGDVVGEEHASDPNRTRSSRSVVRPAATPDRSEEATIAALSSVVGDRPRLPTPSTSFVGRERELATLKGLLGRSRLVTLVGPGGAGKTRLAMQLAAAAETAWFADLTEARDHEALCAATARALGVALPAGQPPELAVGRALAERGAGVLVLDNFEQVVELAGGTVGAWLAAAPRATFVVTSREPLKLEGEQAFEVPPLEEAAELFLERARAARPGWAPTEADRSAVAEIVASLDGLPLAIELAAARMAMLSPSQLVQRLPRRFDLLAGGLPNASARQATMRGAIDWSWELLQPHEQSALAQLGVFRGGFSIDAVDAVVDLAQFPGAPWPLDVVQTLKEKSLVRAWDAAGFEGELRFGLLESIREYALEKLRAFGELEPSTKRRHATFFLAQGAAWAAMTESPKAVAALDRLQLERDNLLAVFQRAVEAELTPETALVGLEAALALDPLLLLRGPWAAHLLMLETATARAAKAGLDSTVRARGLISLSISRQGRGQMVAALADLDVAATLTSDPKLLGRIHHAAAASLRQQGQMDAAKARYEQALALTRQAGDRWTEGRVLGHLGGLSQEVGAVDASRQFYERALAIHREVGDRRFEGIVLANLGSYHSEKQNLAQARKLFEESLAVHREVGNLRSEGVVLSNLASLLGAEGRYPEAYAVLQRALAVHREVGNSRSEAITTHQLGVLHLEQRKPLEAERFFGQALAALRKVGDRRYLGAALASRAAALADLGRVAEAQQQLAEAETELEGVTEAHFHAVLAISKAHLDVARGQPARAREVMKRVRAPSGEHPSLADQSEHVRSALRCLDVLLDD